MRAAEQISRPLKRRKGITVDNVNKVDLESDDDDEGTRDCIVSINMDGYYDIADYYTGEMVYNATDAAGHQMRWKMLAWIAVEKARAWPKLARLQWIAKLQEERGEQSMTKELMREVYETENYYDKMYYEYGERCKDVIDDEVVKKKQSEDETNDAKSSTYTTTLRDSAPYRKETTGVERITI